MRSNTKRIALGGMLAAVCVVIMCLGGLIPVATYVSPMLCCMTQFIVLRLCGRRIAWTWFVAVCILSLIMSPDKESGMVFVAIGCYPMLKPMFEKVTISALLKISYFNISIFTVYSCMIRLMGMRELAAENVEFGLIGFALILVLGNATFLLLDRLLSIMGKRFH